MNARVALALLVVFSMLGWPKSSAASNKNYYGIVRRVALLSDDGSFVVTVNTDAFDDCAYK